MGSEMCIRDRFYLVPMFAAVGVAYGIMLSEGVVFVISTIALLPYLDKREMGLVTLKIALAGAMTGASLSFFQHGSMFFTAPLGALVYIVTLLVLRTFSPQELEAAVAMVTFHKRLRWIRRRLFKLDAQGMMQGGDCLLYTSPSPRDRTRSRMPSSA